MRSSNKHKTSFQGGKSDHGAMHLLNTWVIHMVSFCGFFSLSWVWPRQPRLAPPSLLSGPTIPTNPPLCLTVRANNKTLGLKNSENSLLIPVFLHNFLELALNKTTATTVIVVRAVLHQVRISRQYESLASLADSVRHKDEKFIRRRGSRGSRRQEERGGRRPRG